MGLIIGIVRLVGLFLLMLLRFFWPLLLAAGIFWLIRRIRRNRGAAASYTPPREPHFDGPVQTVSWREVPEEDADGGRGEST